jgi:hypothetical protein
MRGVFIGTLKFCALVSTARSQTFTDCPPRYTSTAAAAFFQFTTDPGVDYATFASIHDDVDLSELKWRIGENTIREYHTFVRLPLLTTEPAKQHFTWRMSVQRFASRVHTTDTKVACQVTQSCVDEANAPGDGTAEERTLCPATRPAAAQSLGSGDEYCVGDDFVFHLGDATSSAARQMDWTFIARLPSAEGLDCVSGKTDCCEIVIRVAGASLYSLLRRL